MKWIGLCGSRWLFALVLALFTNVGFAAEFTCPSQVEAETARLINAERAKVGLSPLIYDVRLGFAAKRHSDDMAKNCFMSHTGSDGSTFSQRVAASGYSGARGEIIAAGYSTPSQVVAAWMNSSGHRAIILTASNLHFGGALAFNSACNYRYYWTFVFGASTSQPATTEQYCAASVTPIADPQPSEPQNLPALQVTAIAPNQVRAGQSIDVVITGANIPAGSTLTFSGGSGKTPVAAVLSVSSDGSRLSARVATRSGGPRELSKRYWDVIVTAPDGRRSSIQKAFLVFP